MRTLRLKTVDAFIAFDFECPTSAGGTRLASDVTARETRLLARAMTYKFAVLGLPIGGAKAAIRATPAGRAKAIRSYCDEILPLVLQQRFLTATDLGTTAEDFKSLPSTDSGSLMHAEHAGMALDAYITGLGVTVAADTALGGLRGRTVAIEGFGKVGGATALAMAARGARVVGISTVHGSVYRGQGFEVGELLRLRALHGDRLVQHLGEAVLPAGRLFGFAADVLVPGARIGVINARRAAALKARVVAPAANVPYTRGGLAVLRERGVLALADFVCNAGATIGYTATGLTTSAEAERAVEERVRALTRESLAHPDGPFEGARVIAERFLSTWVPEDRRPASPPLA